MTTFPGEQNESDHHMGIYKYFSGGPLKMGSDSELADQGHRYPWPRRVSTCHRFNQNTVSQEWNVEARGNQSLYGTEKKQTFKLFYRNLLVKVRVNFNLHGGALSCVMLLPGSHHSLTGCVISLASSSVSQTFKPETFRAPPPTSCCFG